MLRLDFFARGIAYWGTGDADGIEVQGKRRGALRTTPVTNDAAMRVKAAVQAQEALSTRTKKPIDIRIECQRTAVWLRRVTVGKCWQQRVLNLQHEARFLCRDSAFMDA